MCKGLRSRTLWCVSLLSLCALLTANQLWQEAKHDTSKVHSFYFSPRPLYRQTDPRWAKERIGGSKEPIRAVGCVLTSVSMALAHYGIDLPPGKLNRLVKRHKGYNKRGWFRWRVVSKVSKGQLFVEIPKKPDRRRILRALANKEPVIAKVHAFFSSHWVLIVGQHGKDYWIKDPLGRGNSLEKLSKWRSAIHAIRIIRRSS